MIRNFDELDQKGPAVEHLKVQSDPWRDERLMITIDLIREAEKFKERSRRRPLATGQLAGGR